MPSQKSLGQIRPLSLHSNRLGTSGSPVLILHGLLGSSRNWHSVAQLLSRDHSVVTVDLRNHGQSPHNEEMDYPHLLADVRAVIQHRQAAVHLIGHSLGGKVAMAVALTHPELLRTITVVDIAPVAYRDRYTPILKALNSVDLESTFSRTAVDRELSRAIPQSHLRQFLLMNLVSSRGGLRWRVNLGALQRALPKLLSFPESPPTVRFTKPTLFIAGARSDYIRPHHHSLIRHLFPTAHVEVIDNAGHWPHVENPAHFAAALLRFLRDCDDSAEPSAPG